MRKYVFSFVLLLLTIVAVGQKKSIVQLIRSKSSTGIKLNGKDVIKVYDGTFKQDFSTLSSDSAYFYPQDNAFDAFGHVNINQGDTLNIYGDKLNYNGNTKVAIMTDNVRMVDKDATLTTNHLIYNTATRIGTYTDGGKLVNKDNTLLSKNGYYFAFTRDSYFRYNVSLTTPDALVLTDTMRYNTGTRISYFYGPTNIYSTKGEKDKDTLYTENGNYNTVNEQARFGKHNKYKSGTKSLNGDSLFYDKMKGYGRAVKHVTFHDNEQNVTIKGDLGTYFKADERTVITQDPYVILVTENKDTTKTDSSRKADSIAKKQIAKVKNGITMAGEIKKTIPSTTVDFTLDDQGKVKVEADSVIKKLPQVAKDVKLPPVVPNTIPARIDTVSLNKKIKPDQIDSARKLLAKAGITTTPPGKINKKPVSPSKATATVTADNKDKLPAKPVVVKDTSHIKRDSIYMSADSIETQILTYKNLKIYQEKQRLAHIRDTTSKPKKPKVPEKLSKFLTYGSATVTIFDTSFHHRDALGKPKPVYKKPAPPKTKKQMAQDSVKKKKLDDSIAMAKKMEPADTARIRIIIAHHHFKLFKSDLQSKSDSMFYSNVDSTIRCYVNPIMWTEGSQLSGDTIYMQMKHKKLDNMTSFPNAFIVNIAKGDSVHFNQIAGRRMRGYFKNDKLNHMLIEGNAESIYFSRDSAKNTVDGMERSLSSRISVDFKNNQATNIVFYVKPAHTYGPLAKFKEDDKILKGFIWKPKERPVSKESIIPSYTKKADAAAKALADKNKPKTTKKPGDKAAKDSTQTKPPGKLPLKAGKDSTAVKPAVVTPGLKTTKDSATKAAPIVLPPVKVGDDSGKLVKKDTTAVKKPE